MLLENTDEPMPGICELLLMFAARATHIENVIRAAIERAHGLCATVSRMLPMPIREAVVAWTANRSQLLETLVQRDLRPDLTLLLDAPLGSGGGAREGSQQHDRHHRSLRTEQREFFQRVRNGYLERGAAKPQRIASSTQR